MTRYDRLPSNPEAANELDDVVDSSDDESEDHPLSSVQSTSQSPPARPQPAPGADSERGNYDLPPPGSPPSLAFPNTWGNSNGQVPSFDGMVRPPPPRITWLRKTAVRVLPTNFVQKWGLAIPRPAGSGRVGGGEDNDGVFANVTAKPSPPRRVQDGDETYIIPEDSRPEAPPSYSTAQADAVPSYWDTTVNAPFSSDVNVFGEMVIDNLPTGSLFSFLWNMLVSISFQFVGFLLTYLLHTTHAARLGSRAGLGITLIQYGFALRGKADSFEGTYGDGSPPDRNLWGEPLPSPTPEDDSFGGSSLPNGGNSTEATAATMQILAEEQASMIVADATTEWLSFFLMTVGWFVLLTSLLGFWRVKHWERSVIATQRQNAEASSASTSNSSPQPARLSRFRQLGDFFRQGFGLPRRHGRPRDEIELALAEEGHSNPPQRPRDSVDPQANTTEDADENDILVLPGHPDPERARTIAEILRNEQRLQRDLRTAGLI